MTFQLKLGIWKGGRECAKPREQKMQKPQGRNKASMSAGREIRNDVWGGESLVKTLGSSFSPLIKGSH